jgi:hypothetical protein
MKKADGGRSLALLTAVSAPRAWAWKTVLPTSSALELTDTQYRFAARFNLGLQPAMDAAALPDTCPICNKDNALGQDSLHFLSCQAMTKGEVTTRHDEVARALYHCALSMGIRAQLEPKGLDPSSELRPDLLLTLPGRLVLTDVAVCHPLAPGALRAGQALRPLGRAKQLEYAKRAKYTQISARHGFVQLPFAVETTGGLGPSAVKLVKAMAEASEERLAMWSKDAVIRELVGTVAMAVQRGGALAYFDGMERSLGVMRMRAEREKAAVLQADCREVDEDDEGDEMASEGAGGHRDGS